MLIRIHPDNPAERLIQQVVECLNDGGVIIYPTDTVYGIGCDIFKSKAVERVAQIKGINKDKTTFSFICHDLSSLSQFSKPIPNHIFKLMKANLPGPFTFILEASNNVPKIIHGKKKNVGIRVPDNRIITQIVDLLGHPIVSTSVKEEEENIEYTTDPELIYEKYRNLVDIVIDGGYGGIEPSTIVDCTGDEIEIVRQGKGII